MTMDYSPWLERENWPFLKVAISPKPERSRTPKLVCVHFSSIPICMNFLNQFRSIKFFDGHGHSPLSERENWLFLKVAISPKPEKSHSPNLVYMLVTCVYTCMNFLSRFRSIKFFYDHGL